MGSQPSIKQIPNATWLIWGTAVLWSGFFHGYLLWGLLWAWATSFVILNILSPKISLSLGRQLLIWLAVGGLSLSALTERPWEKLLANENLAGLSARLEDKAALENPPLIFPRHLAQGTPQDFYLYAPGSERASLKLGSENLPARALGQGLFRLSLRTDLVSIETESIAAELITDAGSHTRQMKIIKPLPHPKVACGSGSSQAYILSENTDSLVIVNQGGIIATLPTGNGPSGCVHLGDRLYVSHLYENFIWEFDLETRKVVGRHDVHAPQKSITSSHDGQILAATVLGTKPGVILLEPKQPGATTYIPLPVVPEWIAAGKNSQSWLISSRQQPALIRIQYLDKGWVHTKQLLSRPLITMVSARNGRSLYAATTGYSPSGQPLSGNHYIQDQILEFDTTSLEVIARLLTHKRTEKAKAPGDFLKWTAGAGPSSITVLGNGKLLVAFSGTTEWWEAPASLSGLVRALPIRPGGLRAPHGAAQLLDGTLVLTSPAEGTVALFNPALETTELHQLGPTDEALEKSFPSALKRRQGEKAFYEATRSGRACQSCHLHADSDHTTHNIGDELLEPATLSVRGIAGTAPYLRGGVYNQVRQLLHVPQELLGGYFIDDPQRGENIEAFIGSLTLPVANLAPASDTELDQQKRGLQLFVQARCIQCHSFPAFTNLSQHPARRIFPEFPEPNLELDTPSLMAIKHSPPYLFDGRAQTLGDVLGKEFEGTQHGRLEALSSPEKSDLIAFLESL